MKQLIFQQLKKVWFILERLKSIKQEKLTPIENNFSVLTMGGKLV